MSTIGVGKRAAACYTPRMATARGALTYRDLRHTPDDGQRWEIIDGEVYVSPAPSLRHQDAVLNLAMLLSAHVRRHRLGTFRPTLFPGLALRLRDALTG